MSKPRTQHVQPFDYYYYYCRPWASRVETRIPVAEDHAIYTSNPSSRTTTRWFQPAMKLSNRLRSSFLSSVLNPGRLNGRDQDPY